jgi:hypothetical protein
VIRLKRIIKHLATYLQVINVKSIRFKFCCICFSVYLKIAFSNSCITCYLIWVCSYRGTNIWGKNFIRRERKRNKDGKMCIIRNPMIVRFYMIRNIPVATQRTICKQKYNGYCWAIAASDTYKTDEQRDVFWRSVPRYYEWEDLLRRRSLWFTWVQFAMRPPSSMEYRDAVQSENVVVES